jgi:hypothetical protein
MVYWGLRLDVDLEELLAHLKTPEAEQQAAAKKWREQGAQVPHAVNGGYVSGEFLWLGSYIFAGSTAANPAFEAARGKFNEEARSAMPELMSLILSLPKLPKPMVELLNHFSHNILMVGYTHPKG